MGPFSPIFPTEKARENYGEASEKSYFILTSLDGTDSKSVLFGTPLVSISRNISVLLLTYAHSVEAKAIQLWPFVEGSKRGRAKKRGVDSTLK